MCVNTISILGPEKEVGSSTDETSGHCRCVGRRLRRLDCDALERAGAGPADCPIPGDIRQRYSADFESHCWSCHGDATQMSKLDLRTSEAAITGGAHGTVLVPGNAEQSKLYRMIAGLEKPAMPPQGAALTSEQIAAVKAWIDQRAQTETPVSFAKDIQPLMG